VPDWPRCAVLVPLVLKRILPTLDTRSASTAGRGTQMRWLTPTFALVVVF
jgi:hypothetical protein